MGASELGVIYALRHGVLGVEDVGQDLITALGFDPEESARADDEDAARTSITAMTTQNRAAVDVGRAA